MPYATTTKISGPIATAQKEDVHLGGLAFNYQIGLMFPVQAAINNAAYVGPPPISTLHQPSSPAGGLH